MIKLFYKSYFIIIINMYLIFKHYILPMIYKSIK